MQYGYILILINEVNGCLTIRLLINYTVGLSWVTPYNYELRNITVYNYVL